MDELAIGQNVLRGYVLHEERLLRHESADDRTDFDSRFGQFPYVRVEQRRILEDERKREVGNEFGFRSDFMKVVAVFENLQKLEVIRLALLDDFVEVLELVDSDESVDFGRPEVVGEIVEGILRIEIVYSARRPEALLFFGRQVPVPSVRADLAELVRKFGIVGTDHAPFERGHVVSYEKRKGRGETEISEFDAGGHASERLAVVFQEDDSPGFAIFPYAFDIRRKSEEVRKEKRLEIMDFISFDEEF